MGGIPGPLALDEPGGEPLDHLQQQILHRAEVVVHQPVVDARAFGDLARGEGGMTGLEQHLLGGVDQCAYSVVPRRRNGVGRHRGDGLES